MSSLIRKSAITPIKSPLFILLLNLLLVSNISYGQSLFDTFGGQTTTRSGSPSDFTSSQLVTERIHRISESRRIFILTNSNQGFSRGDYISLVLDNDLAVRALVAETTDDNLAGIKILQIYSLTLWNRLREGRQVQVIRGDDTAFRLARQDQQSEDRGIIQDERDLFDEMTFLENDLIFGEDGNREINQDNIVSVYLGLIEGIDNDGTTRRYNQLNGSWSYQFQDNIWVEAAYGRTVINDFPNPQLDTTFTNMTLKVKYTVSAPFHSYVKPYIGYQILDATAPGAGEPDGTLTPEELDAELRRLENLKKSELIFGVTGLKRLVPGWFIRGDFGSDAISIGLALEF